MDTKYSRVYQDSTLLHEYESIESVPSTFLPKTEATSSKGENLQNAKKAVAISLVLVCCFLLLWASDREPISLGSAPQSFSVVEGRLTGGKVSSSIGDALNLNPSIIEDSYDLSLPSNNDMSNQDSISQTNLMEEEHDVELIIDNDNDDNQEIPLLDSSSLSGQSLEPEHLEPHISESETLPEKGNIQMGKTLLRSEPTVESSDHSNDLEETSCTKITKGSGNLINGAMVVQVFFGSLWTTDNTTISTRNWLIKMQQAMLGSSTFREPLKQYGVTTAAEMYGASHYRYYYVPTSITTVRDRDLKTWLAGWVNGNQLPGKGFTNFVYVFFFQPGITITANNKMSCTNFCSYHNSTGTLPYIVIPYLGSGSSCHSKCQFSNINYNYGYRFSHEMDDTLTNPFGKTWFDRSNNNEVADYCPNRRVVSVKSPPSSTTMTPYAFDQLWSNTDCKCVPV